VGRGSRKGGAQPWAREVSFARRTLANLIQTGGGRMAPTASLPFLERKKKRNEVLKNFVIRRQREKVKRDGHRRKEQRGGESRRPPV